MRYLIRYKSLDGQKEGTRVIDASKSFHSSTQIAEANEWVTKDIGRECVMISFQRLEKKEIFDGTA